MPTTRVLIDSRHIAKKRHAFSYHVRFEDLDIPVLRQVTRMEIKSVLFPKVRDEAYVLLRFNDLWPSSLHTSHTSTGTQDCTTAVFFDNGSMVPGAYKVVKGSDLAIREIVFDTTQCVGVIYQFDVEIRKHDGSIPDPELDTGGATDHVVLLEFTHA